MSYFQSLKDKSPLNEAVRMPFNGSTCLTYCIIQDGKKHFLKELKPEFQHDSRYQNIFTKEFEVGRELNHPNIVKYIHLSRNEGAIYMLMEYVEGETLEEVLKQNPDYFKNIEHLKRFVAQLLQGLEYLHSHEILHLDLTPSNIIISKVNHVVKIIDLGFCYTSDRELSIGRTDRFAAPEQQLDNVKELDSRTDLYAVGRVLQEIENTIGHTLPKKYHQLMQKCLQADKEMRPNHATDCLKDLETHNRGIWFLTSVLLLMAMALCLGLTNKSFRESMSFVIENFHMNDYDIEFREVHYRILSETERTCAVVNVKMGKDSLFTGLDINIPSEVEHMGKMYKVVSLANLSLSRQTEVKSIQLPDGLEYIGSEVFWNDSSITTLNIPNSVKEIGPHAFQSCERLEHIKLSQNLKTIPYQAFQECRALTQITIPEGVESIGMDCFINCYNLKEVILPASLKRLDRGAFYLCKKLETIILPEKLEEFGDYVFHHCDNLTDVYNLSPIPQPITQIFDRTDIRLHVPTASVELYKQAQGWKELNIIALTKQE